MADIIPRFFRSDEDSIFRRVFARLDWGLLTAALVLSAIGLFSIYSATSATGQSQMFVTRQGAALVAGLLLMIIFILLPYQIFKTYAAGLYLASIVILICVLFFGVRLRGSRSWFNLHIFYFQPVEVTRLILAMVLAAFVDRYYRELRDWSRVVIPFMMAGLHVGLILLQPDFSSTLNIMPMMLAILYAAGVSAWGLLAVVVIGMLATGIPLGATYFSLMGARLASGPVTAWIKEAFLGGPAFFQLWGGVCAVLVVVWWFLRKLRVPIHGLYLACGLAVIVTGVAGSFGVKKALKEYQRKRLIAFVDPKIDPLGAGYNILQSEIAIGSGRFFGKGYLSGSQSQLGFLPEQHTDFIFSLIAEEQGFFWTLLVLGIYFWVVWRAFDIASTARDRYGRFLAVGMGTIFAFSGLFNIGMTMGMMPVTGVPLPFVSYGGSSLVGAFMAIGILLSIHLRRYVL